MKPEKTCKNHPDREARSFCHHCADDLCNECLQEGPRFYYCRKIKCKKALRDETELYGKKCPSCGANKKFGSIFCHSCGYRLKPVAEREKGDLVTLSRYGNAIEAHLARTKLESQGVLAFVFDEHTISLNPIYDIALGGVRVKIKNSDLKKALKILGPRASGTFWAPSALVLGTHLLSEYVFSALLMVVGALFFCIIKFYYWSLVSG